MNIEDIVVCWRSRDTKRMSSTDEDGYHERIFNFADGHNETALVRNDNLNSAAYQRELFKSPTVLIDIRLWHTKDKKKMYIEAYINQNQNKVEVP